MINEEARNEALIILIQRHKEEFNKIYREKAREVEKYGGILK